MAVFKIVTSTPISNGVEEHVLHYSGLGNPAFTALTSPLTLEINKSGNLSFSIMPVNDAYSSIVKLKTIVKVYRDEALLWKGRVLDVEIDFYNKKTVKCEGWMSVLMDSLIEPLPESGGEDEADYVEFTIGTLLSYLISNHNTQMGAQSGKQLTLYLGENMPADVKRFPKPNYDATLDYIESNIVNEYGGRFWVDDDKVYYYPAGQEPLSNQTIMFGENLIDITRYTDASEIYTVLIATANIDGESGQTEIKTTVENAGAIEAFGRIYHHEDLNDERIVDTDTLGTVATEKLSKAIVEATTITITAFDLSLLSADESKIALGSIVTVRTIPHGINSGYLCSGISYDISNPANTKYTLGITPETLTDKNLKMARKMFTTTYSGESKKTDIRYMVYDERVQILFINFYRSGSRAYLSFKLKMLKQINNSNPTELIMVDEHGELSSDYAPGENVSVTATNETTGNEHPLNIKTQGYIQVLNGSAELAVNDVISGSASWNWVRE